jgi:hypothetical protein
MSWKAFDQEGVLANRKFSGVCAWRAYLDQLEWQTGLKANRGMIARRALELFLASHTSENASGREE